MKRILGLDIGVSSVGLAVIKVDEQNNHRKIEKLAVRIVPEDPNFHGKFYSGNTASKNLARTTARGIRRNNQRFKQRRDKLYEALKKNRMFPSDALMDLTAIELYKLRADTVSRELSLQEIGRVFIHLNQRRGFLSNRKSVSEEENSSEYKQRIAALEDELDGKTIGQRLYEEIQGVDNPLTVLLRERTYLRSSYIGEFDRIWKFQKQFHPEALTGGGNEDNKGTFYDTIRNKIIYYQRPLKSQKGLIADCLFEKHHKAVSKSSPYFEIFRIWQKVNDLEITFEDGSKQKPDLAEKQQLFDSLFYGDRLNGKFKLTVTKIKGFLGLKRNQGYVNFTELDGSRTYSVLKNALEKAKVENPEQHLFFNLDKDDEKGGLFELWHITYSLPIEKEVVTTLVKRFGFSESQAAVVAKEVHYKSDYGSLSTRAIRKLLPYMQEGLGYSEACDKVGYDHSGYKTIITPEDELKSIPKNSLRNPVVEQILNQVVNVVNMAMEKHGKFDEIRVELAQELRNSAKQRKNISSGNAKNKRENNKIRDILRKEYGFKIVNGRDVKRYKLWKDTGQQCLYCNHLISNTEFVTGQAEIEHILPKSRSFSNSMHNFILAHRKCNDKKGQLTAYDFMQQKDQSVFNQYLQKVNALYKDGKGVISKAKFENLLCSGKDIPSDFVERMKKDSQYIAKETVKMLKNVCENVYTTTGQVTDFLREKWELKNLLQEINLDKYRAIGQTEDKEIKDNVGNIKTIEIIKDWSKRDDHRHHAVDALICALTDQKIIFKLNNLNKIYQEHRESLSFEELEAYKKDFEDGLNIKSFADISDNWFDLPIENLRHQAREHLDSILVSVKKSSKVLSRKINTPKNVSPQITWSPRGRLHEDTVMGRVKRIAKKPVKINTKFNMTDLIVNPDIKKIVKNHLSQYNDDHNVAFHSKTLKKNPLLYLGKELKEGSVYEEVCTKRVALSENITDAQIEKITDTKIKEVVKERVAETESIKKAFGDLENNPVWLNKEKGIQIKSVTVYDESKVEKVRNGYVKTGGNHHALIYLNDNGKYIDKVVSFWDAVEMGKQHIVETGKPYPIIKREDDSESGKFLFSMQINDLFVFDLKHAKNPQEENEVNFLNSENRALISKKLFRVQKMSKKSNGQFIVNFRHHLETTVNRNDQELKNITWIEISKNSDLSRLTKIKINHLGEIIKIGE